MPRVVCVRAGPPVWVRGGAPLRASALTWGSGGDRLDGDFVTEALDLVGEASSVSLFVTSAVEPVSPEVGVVGFVGQDVPDDDQHRVGDDEDGLGLALLAEPAAEPPVQGDVVAVLRVRGRPGRLNERRSQGGVALARLPRSALAGGLVVARAHPCPAGEVGGRREPAHVHPDLGHDHFGGDPADAHDGAQPLNLTLERGDHRPQHQVIQLEPVR